ncbi:hypothetical protein WOLCODRAFT_135068 [Wolfiporia cocos MD-104 SS10]|uniref:Uncharacterized protein n=1 Tax=Wolfiporia cocos (strain MD-104) TaxID=742152 RepID=A0A2H3J3M3_WOLCO|nr:hypothetical protein WOLCODRAFT_135068 [Wolfiporia cocos MD-104 SS10]
MNVSAPPADSTDTTRKHACGSSSSVIRPIEPFESYYYWLETTVPTLNDDRIRFSLTLISLGRPDETPSETLAIIASYNCILRMHFTDIRSGKTWSTCHQTELWLRSRRAILRQLQCKHTPSATELSDSKVKRSGPPA